MFVYVYFVKGGVGVFVEGIFLICVFVYGLCLCFFLEVGGILRICVFEYVCFVKDGGFGGYLVYVCLCMCVFCEGWGALGDTSYLCICECVF